MIVDSNAAVDLKMPALDYTALSPMLILFGAACLGVLIEAFVPRRSRHASQFLVALVALVVSLVMVVRVGESGARKLTANVAIAVDGPSLFLQGTLAVLGIVALLLIAERSLEQGGPFVAHAAVTVG